MPPMAIWHGREKSHMPSQFDRAPLQPGTFISLRKCDSKTAEEQQFEILDILGSGSSIISYRVKFLDTDMRTYFYVLKEVYPKPKENDVSIIRSISNSLQIDEYEQNSKYRNSYQYCKNIYKGAYDLQLKMANGMAKNEILNLSTSAPFGLYEDPHSSSTGNYALYALFRYQIGKRYDMIETEDLESILYTQKQIATVVQAYIENGFLWLDIKEKNIYIVGNGALKSVSFFDFDSMFSIQTLKNYHFQKDVPPEFVISFTPSSEEIRIPKEMDRILDLNRNYRQSLFPDMELAEKCIHNLAENGIRTELFLLGSLLFKRIFKYAPSIETCKKLQSNILPECPALNQYSPNIREMLRDVLKKLLNYDCPKKRYNSIQEYLHAIDKLILAIHRHQKQPQFVQAIQQQLYQYPLYHNVPHQEGNRINTLLIGLGDFGTKFLDVSLQAIQIPGKDIHATILLNSREEKEQYLSERPCLKDFFHIDTTHQDTKDWYGFLNFLFKDVHKNDETKLNALFSGLFASAEEAPHAIFIDTGDDAKNLKLAKIVHKVWNSCDIHFVWESKNPPEIPPCDVIHPLCICTDFQKSDIAKQMEQIAFNVHLLWEKDLNLNYREVRKNYRKPYNHGSCISYIFSLKYKLYALGFELEQTPPEELAKQYAEYLQSHAEERLNLIYYEHRRWVTEKLCEGYHLISDLNFLPDHDTTHNQDGHIFLLRSTPKQGLSTWTHEMWDDATPEMLEQLDELEQLSVKLHQNFREHANPMTLTDLEKLFRPLQEILEKEPTLLASLQEWYTCIWNLFSETSHARLYKGLKDKLSKGVDQAKKAHRLTANECDAIEKEIEGIHHRIYPIYASKLYYDYKNEDVKLVDAIPFILTYSEKNQMAIPYALSEADNTMRFGNVAAISIVNPASVLYFCYCDSTEKIAQLRHSIPDLLLYLKRKELKATLKFLIFYPESLNFLMEEADFSLEKRGKVQWIPVKSDCWQEAIAQKLLKLSRKKDHFSLEKRAGDTLSDALDATGIFQKIPSYTFDSKNQTFSNLNHCETFAYIFAKPFITITDMLPKSSTSHLRSEFFAEYRDLWAQYQKSPATWKELCCCLRNHAAAQDTIASMRIDKTIREPEEFSYILPISCRTGVQKVVQALQEQEIVTEESKMIGHTSDSCKLILHQNVSCQSLFDQLFENLQCFALPDLIVISCVPDGKDVVDVSVSFDSLTVKGLPRTSLTADERHLLEMLQKKMGYLVGTELNTDGETLQFTYATYPIKKMLTNPERILEIYTYHAARETGRFHDVKCRLILQESDTTLTCVLTKNFTSFFAVYVPPEKATAAFVAEISKQVKNVGIHPVLLFLTDTEAQREKLNDLLSSSHRTEETLPVSIFSLQEKSENFETFLCRIADH